MKKIEICDREIFIQHFKDSPIINSEYAFSTLLVWQEKYNFCYEIVNDTIIVFGTRSNGDLYCYYPIGSVSQNLEYYFNYVKAHFESINSSLSIRPLSEEMIGKLINFLEEGLIISTKNSYADYIYCTNDIRNYTGKKYHHKRNLVNYFEQNYNYEYRIISNSKDIEDCKNSFFRVLNMETFIDKDELKAGERLFKYYNELQLIGCYVLVDEKVEGFAIGEEYGNNFALLHMRRANKLIKGIYPSIFKYFAAEVVKSQFINSQDDLGNANIRKSKLSYKPIKILKKYFIEGN